MRQAANLEHQTVFSLLPLATQWPLPTTWIVTDCSTTACTSGGGLIMESFTNAPTGTVWTLQIQGQGSGSGANVECSISVPGGSSAACPIQCQDENIYYSLVVGTNNCTLAGNAAGYRHKWILTQPATGNAVFTFPSTDHGGFIAGTDALAISAQSFVTLTDGVNAIADGPGTINIPTTFTAGTFTVGTTTVGSLSSLVLGLEYPKSMIIKSYCPFCASGTGNAAFREIALMTTAGVKHLRIVANEKPGTLGSGNRITYVAASPVHNTANDEIGNLDLANFGNFICSVPNLTFTYGINYLGNNSTAVVAEATEVNTLFGSSGTACANRLAGFEIGNEPGASTYGPNGNTSAVAFANGWNTYATAIRAAVPSAQFVGPSAGVVADIATYVPPFLTANASLLGTLTQHYYAEGTPSGATIAGITLNAVAANVTTIGGDFEGYSAANSNIPIEYNEGNTVASGGAAGVSNTFASAIWAVTNALDFTVASVGAGVVTVDYSSDGSPYYSNTYSQGYSAIVDGSGFTGPNPMIMGDLLLHLIGSGTMKNCTVSISGVNIRCYAVVNGAVTEVVLVNQDATANAQIAISLPNTVSAATSIQMTAPSLTDTVTADTTIQGSSVSNAGVFSPGPATTETVAGGNSITTIVPAHSIKVVSAQ